MAGALEIHALIQNMGVGVNITLNDHVDRETEDFITILEQAWMWRSDHDFFERIRGIRDMDRYREWQQTFEVLAVQDIVRLFRHALRRGTYQGDRVLVRVFQSRLVNVVNDFLNTKRQVSSFPTGRHWRRASIIVSLVYRRFFGM